MISQTAEYALRAVAFLAGQEMPRTTAEISSLGCMPAGYLAKVMQQLTRAGLVTSQRGVRGGFLIARSPDTMSVLDVVNAVDPIRRFGECPLGLDEHGTDLCPLHRKLDDAAALVESAFGSTRVSDLLPGDETTRQGCDFPLP